MRSLFYTLAILFLFCKITIGQVGASIFDDSKIHTISINSLDRIKYEEFHDELFRVYKSDLKNNTSDKTYTAASVVIDSFTIDTIGLRYKGQSTFKGLPANGKYSFKIDFNEFILGQKFDGLKKLSLNNNRLDVTCMRNKLALESMMRMGIEAPRTSYAKVFVNGANRGLYLLVEQVDEIFVNQRFSSDSTGFLYDVNGWTGGPQVAPTPSNLEKQLLPKTRRDENNYQSIIDVWNITNETPDSLFYDVVSEVYDYDNFIRQMAVQTFVGDRDHYCVSGSNHYLYQNPKSGKFVMIPWDYDLSWIKDWYGGDYLNIRNPVTWSDCSEHQNSVYATKMLNVPEITNKYHHALCEVLNHGFDSLWVEERINTLSALIGKEVVNDPVHFAQFDDFEYQLDNSYTFISYRSYIDPHVFHGMRNLIRHRYADVRDALREAGYDCHYQKRE